MVITALLLGLFNKEREVVILEMPDYSWPQYSLVIKTSWLRTCDFIIGAGKFIIPLAFVLQVLGGISVDFKPVEINQSILAIYSKKLLPFFEPIGVKNWQLVAGLLSGIIAKELIPGTLIAIFSINENHLGSLSGLINGLFSNSYEAFSYMLFILIYFPCISVFAASRREAGSVIAFGSVIWSTFLAYSVSYMFYQISINYF